MVEDFAMSGIVSLISPRTGQIRLAPAEQLYLSEGLQTLGFICAA
jgi:hypothetical protein